MNIPSISVNNDNGFTIVIDGEAFLVNLTHPQFERIKEVISKNDYESLGQILRGENDANSVLALSEKVRFDLANETVIVDGATYQSEFLTKKASQFLNFGVSLQPLKNFVSKLFQNVSKAAIDELLLFLEKTNLPLSDDGDFYAYKMTLKNGWDAHTGKSVYYEVGTTVEMPRNQVCDDRRKTCSAGLHFCSKDYLPSAYYNTERCILLKINPAHVVSIPYDYNNSKGRACEMTVVEEINIDKVSHLFKTNNPTYTDDEDEDVYYNQAVWDSLYDDLNGDDEDDEGDCCNDEDECDCDHQEIENHIFISKGEQVNKPELD